MGTNKRSARLLRLLLNGGPPSSLEGPPVYADANEEGAPSTPGPVPELLEL